MSLSTLISPLASLIFKPKKAKPQAPAPVARERPNSGVSDVLAARRGSHSNKRSGRGGAEAPSSGKGRLLGQSGG